MAKKSVIMKMTGADFLKLVEQKDINGALDTIPEILDFLKGIREDETLEEYIKRIVSSIFKIEEGGVLRITLSDTNE